MAKRKLIKYVSYGKNKSIDGIRKVDAYMWDYDPTFFYYKDGNEYVLVDVNTGVRAGSNKTLKGLKEFVESQPDKFYKKLDSIRNSDWYKELCEQYAVLQLKEFWDRGDEDGK